MIRAVVSHWCVNLFECPVVDVSLALAPSAGKPASGPVRRLDGSFGAQCWYRDKPMSVIAGVPCWNRHYPPWIHVEVSAAAGAARIPREILPRICSGSRREASSPAARLHAAI